ncbi:MAG: hypothetical protein JWO87_20, partial [Phycisphaerales bacterium]|nr:hypothetical protein [Phycisphaerales bacterium]
MANSDHDELARALAGLASGEHADEEHDGHGAHEPEHAPPAAAAPTPPPVPVRPKAAAPIPA